MIDRIIFVSDFLINSNLNRINSEAIFLRKMLGYQLSCVIKNYKFQEVSVIASTEDNIQKMIISMKKITSFFDIDLINKKDINLDNLYNYKINIDSINEKLISYVKKFFNNNDLIITYEMSEVCRYLFDKIGIKYINLWWAPVRFMDDTSFCLTTNNKEIYNKIAKYSIDEEQKYIHANYLSTLCYLRFNVDEKLFDNSILFIGQTMSDKSIIKDDKLLNILDFKSEINEELKKYDYIYYSRHPLAKNDEEILRYISTNKRIILTDIPTYYLLASDKIKKVIGISSSVLTEAKYFGKEVKYYYRPICNINTEFGFNNYVDIDAKNMLSLDFWADILDGMIEIKFFKKGLIPNYNSKNHMRALIYNYYGYDNIDDLSRSVTQMYKIKENNTDLSNINNLLSKFNSIEKTLNNITFITLFKKIQYPKWLIRVICCFILKKKNRQHFRKKYSKNTTNNNVITNCTVNLLTSVFSNIKINHNCNNYLCFDWPFGSYVFDQLLKTKNKKINLVKFSLFDIFNIQNRSDLLIYYSEHKEEFLQKLATYFEKNNEIKSLLVTHDWLPFHQDIINIFKYLNIPVILILHEGVFQNKDLYYNSGKPISDKALVWGELHKSIFVERGYPEKNVKVVGSIKLNQYKNYRPTITRNEFTDKLQLDKNKKNILYCCQFCDGQWGDQKKCLDKQLEQINDIVKIAGDKYNVIIRNSPAHPNMVIPHEFIEKYKNDKNVVIDGVDIDNTSKSTYLTKAEEALYFADLVIGMNTTMQLEASLLNKPSIIAQYFDFDTKWNRELGLPIADNYKKLEELINTNVNVRHNLIEDNKKETFYKDYGYSEDKNYNPIENIYNELLNKDY